MQSKQGRQPQSWATPSSPPLSRVSVVYTSMYWEKTLSTRRPTDLLLLPKWQRKTLAKLKHILGIHFYELPRNLLKIVYCDVQAHETNTKYLIWAHLVTYPPSPQRVTADTFLLSPPSAHTRYLQLIWMVKSLSPLVKTALKRWDRLEHLSSIHPRLQCHQRKLKWWHRMIWRKIHLQDWMGAWKNNASFI